MLDDIALLVWITVIFGPALFFHEYDKARCAAVVSLDKRAGKAAKWLARRLKS